MAATVAVATMPCCPAPVSAMRPGFIRSRQKRLPIALLILCAGVTEILALQINLRPAQLFCPDAAHNPAASAVRHILLE